MTSLLLVNAARVENGEEGNLVTVEVLSGVVCEEKVLAEEVPDFISTFLLQALVHMKQFLLRNTLKMRNFHYLHHYRVTFKLFQSKLVFLSNELR